MPAGIFNAENARLAKSVVGIQVSGVSFFGYAMELHKVADSHFPIPDS